MAAYAEIEGDQLWVRALVAEPDASVVYRAEARGPLASAGALGQQVGEDLLQQGADEILARLSIPTED